MRANVTDTCRSPVWRSGLVLAALLAPAGVQAAPASAPEPAPASALAVPAVTSPRPDAPADWEGRLARADFDAVLSGSPQRIVAAVDVQPFLERGHFRGFQIVRIHSDGVLSALEAIVPGDVILTVNHEPIERPEQFMRAWDVVKSASAVDVEVLRGTRPVRLRWKIEP